MDSNNDDFLVYCIDGKEDFFGVDKELQS